MARVSFTPLQRAMAKESDLRKFIRTTMYQKGITQTMMGDSLGMTQQGFGQALKHMSFNVEQLMLVLDVLNADIEVRSKE